ncbi:MAG: DUF4845 domain-containing protein [Gammaproteobacteria bacterium]|nr:DUF4845 domain-containing protein [Gammaproteobacteria bacterium]MBU2677015.1 DUF4845 domain-containing protein [Gammaproteobacteria bacterium]NNC56440.1 DUF4845 domain-containing protein [Woeseiaceae bacterium]NNL50747.1 DUF4845 domain-containing protein [Woeseiaceae bacterium]
MYLKPLENYRAMHRQSGMTTLGVAILVAFVGLFAFAALRLTPVYLNYMKVASVVSGVYEEFDGAGPSRAAIRSSISRRFDIESVAEINAKDVAVTAVDGGFEVAAAYSHKADFIANVSFVVDFDKRVIIRK